ncbi:MAG: NAD(P)H-dependent oxidoreductase subunit E [Nitrospirae bacterium]|nr:NAD(P)H-dependent oxidoreductase subunit E [Nitrospirota bacterium]
MKKILENIYEGHKKNEGNIISLLQDIQSAFGYIPEDVVIWFSRRLDIPASRFFGIATFYAQFHLTPRGKNIITTCCGTACHVKGSERLINGLMTELDLADGESTTCDKEFTLEKVNCVGACSIAPVVIINDKVHGKVSADNLMKEVRKLKECEVEK